jgi:hypothetical protein
MIQNRDGIQAFLRHIQAYLSMKKSAEMRQGTHAHRRVAGQSAEATDPHAVGFSYPG